MNRHHAGAQPRLFSLLMALLAAIGFAPSAEAAKNVILMISDGGGFNTWAAASMFQGKLGRQVYDQTGWLRLACTTYPLTLAKLPTGCALQDQTLVYDPLLAWDSTLDVAGAGRFTGYDFLTSTPTDSAAAATALASGRKTYCNAINWSSDNRPMCGRSIAEIAKSRGKAVGVVSSMPWSHATPAGLGGAHNVSRYNFAAIANEMLRAGHLDVIIGAGHPQFDNNARPIDDEKLRNYDYVGGRETWQALRQGRLGWWLVESKADLEALAAGRTPAKLLGTVQVAATLQQRRGVGLTASAYDKQSGTLSPERKARRPFTTPLNKNVPTLATLARAALNCLDDDADGFYLMVEGGAVDWAGHANQPDRIIEEQIDFVEAIEAVVDWIESHGGWDETLLILTSDHETGLLWGADSDRIAFAAVEDRGAGRLPGMLFHSHSHSNSLVPLYARGPGSCRFLRLVDGVDAAAAERWGGSGRYVDNTDIYAVMRAEITAGDYRRPCQRRCRSLHRRTLQRRWQTSKAFPGR